MSSSTRSRRLALLAIVAAILVWREVEIRRHEDDLDNWPGTTVPESCALFGAKLPRSYSPVMKRSASLEGLIVCVAPALRATDCWRAGFHDRLHLPGSRVPDAGHGSAWVDHPSWELVEEASDATGRNIADLLLDTDADEPR